MAQRSCTISYATLVHSYIRTWRPRIAVITSLQLILHVHVIDTVAKIILYSVQWFSAPLQHTLKPQLLIVYT